MAKQEMLATIRDRYQESSKKEKGRILDEFMAVSDTSGGGLIWEAADRICGKRLKAALPNLVESMARHGHLDLDPQVRRRLLAASASTLDRLLKPIRATAGGRRKRPEATVDGRPGAGAYLRRLE